MGVVKDLPLNLVNRGPRDLLLELLLEENVLLVDGEVPVPWILHDLPKKVHLVPAHVTKNYLLLRFIGDGLPTRRSFSHLQILVERIKIFGNVFLLLREHVTSDQLRRFPYGLQPLLQLSGVILLDKVLNHIDHLLLVVPADVQHPPSLQVFQGVEVLLIFIFHQVAVLPVPDILLLHIKLLCKADLLQSIVGWGDFLLVLAVQALNRIHRRLPNRLRLHADFLPVLGKGNSLILLFSFGLFSH